MILLSVSKNAQFDLKLHHFAAIMLLDRSVATCQLFIVNYLHVIAHRQEAAITFPELLSRAN